MRTQPIGRESKKKRQVRELYGRSLGEVIRQGGTRGGEIGKDNSKIVKREELKES